MRSVCLQCISLFAKMGHYYVWILYSCFSHGTMSIRNLGVQPKLFFLFACMCWVPSPSPTFTPMPSAAVTRPGCVACLSPRVPTAKHRALDLQGLCSPGPTEAVITQAGWCWLGNAPEQRTSVVTHYIFSQASVISTPACTYISS